MAKKDNTARQLKIILLVLSILSICASAVIAYAVTGETVKHNAVEILEIKNDINANQENIETNTINIAVLNSIATDITIIKQDIKDLLKSS